VFFPLTVPKIGATHNPTTMQTSEPTKMPLHYDDFNVPYIVRRSPRLDLIEKMRTRTISERQAAIKERWRHLRRAASCRVNAMQYPDQPIYKMLHRNEIHAAREAQLNAETAMLREIAVQMHHKIIVDMEETARLLDGMRSMRQEIHTDLEINNA
jgi:hypothetical protein